MFRKALVFSLSSLAFLFGAFGIYRAIHSPLFLVQVVELADQPEKAPVDAQVITELASVPVGEVNLFDLDLRAIERRIMSNPWIREVRLQKRFPQTLSISVSYREPKALLQGDNGSLAYVDQDGKSFGSLTLMYQPDLAMLSMPLEQVPVALEVMSEWEKSRLNEAARISELSWDHEHGYRALVSYADWAPRPSNSISTHRSWVDIGNPGLLNGKSQIFDDGQIARLSHVFAYLRTNSIAARQIWADAGKKIVVKTARGS